MGARKVDIVPLGTSASDFGQVGSGGENKVFAIGWQHGLLARRTWQSVTLLFSDPTLANDVRSAQWRATLGGEPLAVTQTGNWANILLSPLDRLGELLVECDVTSPAETHTVVLKQEVVEANGCLSLTPPGDSEKVPPPDIGNPSKTLEFTNLIGPIIRKVVPGTGVDDIALRAFLAALAYDRLLPVTLSVDTMAYNKIAAAIDGKRPVEVADLMLKRPMGIFGVGIGVHLKSQSAVAPDPTSPALAGWLSQLTEARLAEVFNQLRFPFAAAGHAKRVLDELKGEHANGMSWSELHGTASLAQERERVISGFRALPPAGGLVVS